MVVLSPNESLKFGFHTAEVSQVEAEGIPGIPAAAAQLEHSLPAPPPWAQRPGELPRSTEEASVCEAAQRALILF